ncbi:hypothetical protein F5Y15DRAFT_419277 [Xylariaceae sp. FL0016]|nr:hypothetical protein F5Y15DRAFT_419277 [Xylariaceae sp. FL0016]
MKCIAGFLLVSKLALCQAVSDVESVISEHADEIGALRPFSLGDFDLPVTHSIDHEPTTVVAVDVKPNMLNTPGGAYGGEQPNPPLPTGGYGAPATPVGHPIVTPIVNPPVAVSTSVFVQTMFETVTYHLSVISLATSCETSTATVPGMPSSESSRSTVHTVTVPTHPAPPSTSTPQTQQIESTPCPTTTPTTEIKTLTTPTVPAEYTVIPHPPVNSTVVLSSTHHTTPGRPSVTPITDTNMASSTMAASLLITSASMALALLRLVI